MNIDQIDGKILDILHLMYNFICLGGKTRKQMFQGVCLCSLIGRVGVFKNFIRNSVHRLFFISQCKYNNRGIFALNTMDKHVPLLFLVIKSFLSFIS